MTRVLVASSTDAQARTVRGELLGLPFDCDRPGCGCRQAWFGLGSRETCTVATVVERPDVDRDTLVDMLAAALVQPALPSYTANDARADAAEVVDEVLAIARHFPPGAHLRRDGDEVTEDEQVRRRKWERRPRR